MDHPATEAILAVLANPQAARIFRALPLQADCRGRTTLELSSDLRLPTSSVSRHLSSLQAVGLAIGKRTGRLVHYSRTTDRFADFIATISGWDDSHSR